MTTIATSTTSIDYDALSSKAHLSDRTQKAINRGFRGSKRIRRMGIEIAYTVEQEAEWLRCALDPLYFIENYVKIKNVDEEQLILFKTRFYQKEMVDTIIGNRETIVKLPRQCGKTSCVAALLVWHLIFNPNYAILCAAHKGDKARDVLSNIREMYESLPWWLQHGVEEWSKGFIKLENGSRAKSSATTASSARGDVYNLIYLDEFAFVEDHLAEEFIRSVMPTISSGKTTKTIITSTPQGMNMFYTLWEKAVEKKSRYKYVEIKWNDVPGRDEAFRQDIIDTYGKAYFDQEYGAEFIGSGKTLIAGHVLNRMKGDLQEPINDVRGETKIRVYAHPEKGRTYAICADISEGLLQDASAFIVMDITQVPYTTAMIYQNNEVDETTYGGIIHDTGKAYNDAMILIESNFGALVGRVLWEDLEYPNLIRTAIKKELQKPGGGKRSRTGVRMDVKTKRIGCSTLKLLAEQDQIKVHDEKTWLELQHFVVHNSSYAADRGYDDLAMCMVMFAWMVDQDYIKAMTDTNARDTIAKKNAEMIEQQMVSAGFSIQTPEDVDQLSINHAKWEIAAADDRTIHDHLDTFPFPVPPKPDPTAQSDRAYLVDDETEWTWTRGWKKS
jgi:hypothetical protein